MVCAVRLAKPQSIAIADEIGIYGKQTSCYFQALGKDNVLKDNLCYSEEGKAWAVTVAATLTVGRCCEQTALAPASTVRHLLLPLTPPSFR